MVGTLYGRRMRWTVHGERTVYDSEWVRLALTDVEIPGEGGRRFEHHVLRMLVEEDFLARENGVYWRAGGSFEV
jgi:hypothetical protein